MHSRATLLSELESLYLARTVRLLPRSCVSACPADDTDCALAAIAPPPNPPLLATSLPRLLPPPLPQLFHYGIVSTLAPAAPTARQVPGPLRNPWGQDQLRPRYPRLEEDVTADVVVVGAGLSGLCTAYRLLRAGA